MIRKLQVGGRSLIEPVEIPEGTREIINEILAQNRLVLEQNQRLLENLGNPLMVISSDEDEQEQGE